MGDDFWSSFRLLLLVTQWIHTHPSVGLLLVFSHFGFAGRCGGRQWRISGRICALDDARSVTPRRFSPSAHRQVAQCVSLMVACISRCSHRQRADPDAGSSPAARVSRHRDRPFSLQLLERGVLTATCGTLLFGLTGRWLQENVFFSATGSSRSGFLKGFVSA